MHNYVPMYLESNVIVGACKTQESRAQWLARYSKYVYVHTCSTSLKVYIMQ